MTCESNMVTRPAPMVAAAALPELLPLRKDSNEKNKTKKRKGSSFAKRAPKSAKLFLSQTEVELT